MPELPEVEIARRHLVRWFKGRALVKAEGEKVRTFRNGTVADFRKLEGPLTSAERRGKYLLLQFGERGLLAHLGMTGKFLKRSAKVVEPYSRARLVLDNDVVIHFRDPRMFGELWAMPSSKLMEAPSVKKLGVDALLEPLDGPSLKRAMGSTNLDLKVALMDQTRVAGLGNIHAAEALFRARLHPGRKVKSLSDADWKQLARSIDETIRFALEAEDGEEIEYVEEPGADNPFLIYGRAGTACRVCKTIVKSYTQGGRTTHFCPHCQNKKKRTT